MLHSTLKLSAGHACVPSIADLQQRQVEQPQLAEQDDVS